ncbi:hypothetical protein LBMAG49_07130 [Planctomycetota bacterium]|nr:hypothetical protein LBMAG49_07130 [Planctomycetota bacterium]
MVTIGSKAPAFTLSDHNGKSISLSSLAGQWVVLYFYPRDDTPGCTVEACEFTSATHNFSGLNAVVYGCSADGTESHQKFIEKHNLTVGLLTDADTSVMKSYEAFGTKLMYGKEVQGVIRSTVLIAPDGTIAHHWPKVTAEGHAEAVRARLAELIGCVATTTNATTTTTKSVMTKLVTMKPVTTKAVTTKAVMTKPVTKPMTKPMTLKLVQKKSAAAKPATKNTATKNTATKSSVKKIVAKTAAKKSTATKTATKNMAKKQVVVTKSKATKVPASKGKTVAAKPIQKGRGKTKA